MEEESIETNGFLKCLHILKNGFPFLKIKKKKKALFFFFFAQALFISLSPKINFFVPKIRFKLEFSAFKFKKFQFRP